MAAEGKRGSTTLGFFIYRLQNYLKQSRRRTGVAQGSAEREEVKVAEMVPDDVKEGHFAILAVNNAGETPTRFVLELGLLKHPPLLRLLRRAEEEFGFQQRGALALPCKPEELEMILKDKDLKER